MGIEVKTIVYDVEKFKSFDIDVNFYIKNGWTLTDRGIAQGVLYAFLEKEKKDSQNSLED